jgi:glycosyltransferase involved in cell wall biosynthesis
VEQVPDISIVIPHFNDVDHLFRCLASLEKQKTGTHVEIIVVDSSDRDITEWVQKRFPSVSVLHLHRRTFPGVARNIGVQHSKGDIVAFIDADCVADGEWIQRILESMKNGEYVAIGGSVENGLPKHPIATAEYFIEFGEFMPSRKSGIADLIPSCNMAVRKDVFKKVGGFPSLITSEDVLFCLSLRKHNYQIFFDPSIRITHFNRTVLRKMLHKQRELGIGACQLRKRFAVKGHWLAKFKISAFAIPFLRIYTVVRKVLRNNFSCLPKLMWTFPIWFLALVWYSYGFWQGHSTPQKGDLL